MRHFGAETIENIEKAIDIVEQTHGNRAVVTAEVKSEIKGRTPMIMIKVDGKEVGYLSLGTGVATAVPLPDELGRHYKYPLLREPGRLVGLTKVSDDGLPVVLSGDGESMKTGVYATFEASDDEEYGASGRRTRSRTRHSLADHNCNDTVCHMCEIDPGDELCELCTKWLCVHCSCSCEGCQVGDTLCLECLPNCNECRRHRDSQES